MHLVQTSAAVLELLNVVCSQSQKLVSFYNWTPLLDKYTHVTDINVQNLCSLCTFVQSHSNQLNPLLSLGYLVFLKLEVQKNELYLECHRRAILTLQAIMLALPSKS